MTDLEKHFEAAQAAARKLRAKPDNDTLLELYSYFKHATEGDVSGTRQGAFDFVTGAKYDAWGEPQRRQEGRRNAGLRQARGALAVPG